MNFTSTQKKAFDFQRNISLSAGAGSGKTTVLIHRIIYFLKQLETFSLAQLIAITFTNKAADELKIRLFEALQKEIDSTEDSKLRNKLNFERNLIYSSYICTFDALWKRLLVQHAGEINLEPDFKIIGGYEQKKILEQCIKDTFTQLLVSGDLEFLSLYEKITRKDLTKLIQKAIFHSASFKLELTENDYRNKWSKIYGHYQSSLLEKLKNDSVMEELLDRVLRVSPKNETRSLTQLKIAIQNYKNERSLINAQVWYKLLVTRKGDLRKEHLNQKKFTANEIIVFEDLHESSQTYLADILPNLNNEDDTYFSRYPKFIRILKKVNERYLLEKKRINKFEYSDLIYFVKTLFEAKPEIVNELRQQFHFIMIDEFQDTNFEQWNLIKKLVQKKDDPENLMFQKLFIVGDTKQSIYGFRNAEVTVFSHLQNLILKSNQEYNSTKRNFMYFNEILDSNEEEKNGMLSLDQNYRSNPNSLAFVNQLFSKLFPYKETSFDVQENALFAGKDTYSSDEKVVYFLNKTTTEINSAMEEEAQFIAHSILKERRDKQRQFHHFTILLRTRSKANIIEKELRTQKIPYTNLLTQPFYQWQEVIDFYNMIRFSCFPNDEIALTAVLKSPFFMLKNKKIVSLLFKRQESLLNTLKKEKRLYSQVQHLLNIAKRQTPHQFLERLLIESDYLNHISKENCQRVVENIKRLILISDEFSATGQVDCYDFEYFLREHIQNDIEDNEYSANETIGDSVKIMTIHRAKGLQFNVVFLPFLHEKMLKKVESTFFIKEFGFSASLFTPESEQGSFVRAYFKHTKKCMDFAEEKRILYVAMTRVKEKLYLSSSHIVSTEKEFKIKPESYAGLINYALDNTFITGKKYSHFKIVKTFDILLMNAPINSELISSRFFKNNLVQSSQNIFSSSRISQFESNHFIYYIKYYLGFFDNDYMNFHEEKSSNKGKAHYNSAQLGTIFHKILEEISFNRFDEGIIEKVFERFSIQAELLKLKLKRCLKTFLSSEKTQFIREANLYHKEIIIQSKYGQNYMIGIIDLLVFTDNKWMIIDYKTNLVSLDTFYILARDKYSFQMKFYAYLLAQIYPKQESYPVKLYFTEIDEFYSEEFNLDAIAKFEKLFSGLTKNMMKFELKILNKCILK